MAITTDWTAYWVAPETGVHVSVTEVVELGKAVPFGLKPVGGCGVL